MRKHQAITVILFGLVVAACGGSDSAASTVTANPTTTASTPVVGTAAAATTTTMVATDVDAALALAEMFVTTHNSGDEDSLMVLTTGDARFSNNFQGMVDRESWYQRLAWNNAQGTILTDAVCEMSSVDGADVRIQCTHGTHNAESQAIGAEPVPTVTRLTVTTGGISSVFETYGDPDFNYVGRPFAAWILANHPSDVETTGFGNWATLEEAKANGALVAEHAAEWASYLEANDCEFTDSDC